jgi:hypothetical protein
MYDSSDSGDESYESHSPSPTQQTLSNSSGADDKHLHSIYYKPDIEIQKHPSHHEDQQDTNPERTTYPNSKAQSQFHLLRKSKIQTIKIKQKTHYPISFI